MTLEEICEAKEKARQAYECSGGRNVFGIEPSERIKIDVEYAKDQAEYFRWNNLYQDKIREMATSK